MRTKLLALLILGIAMTGWIYFNQPSHTKVTGIKSGQVVICLGDDLTESQKSEILNLLENKADTSNARIITVTNAEERKFLLGKIDEKMIGTKAISSALVVGEETGRGIQVQTYNINGVSPLMYANAATTAGIKDVQIEVAAPFEVSGTAALTGIIKAFESASGNNLSEKAKETANQEVAESSKLSERIGTEKAGKFINEVKRQVVEKKTTDPVEIRKIIIQVSAELSIQLSEQEINRIVNLMQNINSLNISLTSLNEQLSRLQSGIQDVGSKAEQSKGFLQRIGELIRLLWQSIMGSVS
jgi:uncharacterized protein YpuA (DUF1002 family)